MVGWLSHQLERHRATRAAVADDGTRETSWMAAEAVDPDFADALRGESRHRVWNRVAGSDGPLAPAPASARPQGWRWPWWGDAPPALEVIHRLAVPASDGAAAPGR